MIESKYFWTITALLSIGTITIRFLFIALSAKIKISIRTQEIFSFIPAAILPALIAPMAFYHSGQVAWLLGKERFFILALATIVCYFTKNMLATIGFGLACLYVITNI